MDQKTNVYYQYDNLIKKYGLPALDRDIEDENRTIFQKLSTWLDLMKIWANFWAIFAEMTQKLGSSKIDVLWLDRELRVYILRIYQPFWAPITFWGSKYLIQFEKSQKTSFLTVFCSKNTLKLPITWVFWAQRVQQVILRGSSQKWSGFVTRIELSQDLPILKRCEGES